jgi:hypothetical protein
MSFPPSAFMKLTRAEADQLGGDALALPHHDAS